MVRHLETFDIEVLSNLFTITLYRHDTKEWFQYVIHQLQNDYEKIIEHLKSGVYEVGFNCLSYDYPILHHMINHYDEYKNLSGHDLSQRIYKKSQEIIDSEFTIVADKNMFFPCLDLYRIHHLNNPGRSASLKLIEASLRLENIEDMPYNHDYWFTTWDEINEILKYNSWDVQSTYEFYKVTVGETDLPLYKGKNKLQLRKDILAKYKIPCLNYPDVKIGEQLLLKLYAQAIGKNTWDVSKAPTSPRHEGIKLGECYPSYIKFKTKPFQELLKWISNKWVPGTNGGLKEIPVEEISDLKPYIFPGSIVKKTKTGERTKEILENLNLKIQDMRLDYGTGGIHGSLSGIYESNDEYCILDVDVSSLYPSIAVQNQYYPAHLGPEFSKVYGENIVSVRLREKEKPKKERNFVIMEGLKLAGNGSYGKSGEPTSWLYDPKYMLSITITGQLSLSMLIESILENIKSAKFLQCNTDGISIRLKYSELDNCLKICKEWEEVTKLTLEYAYYKKMVLSDVSNYLAIYEDGNIKHKGSFEIDKELYKNPSMAIIPIALEKYYANGVPVEETIRNHDNIYDFCLVTRVDNRYKMFYQYYDKDSRSIKERPLGKTQRYYASKNAEGMLFKRAVEGGKVIGINAGEPMILFNKYIKKDIKDYDINYNFYVNECRKIIDKIETPTLQQTLF